MEHLHMTFRQTLSLVQNLLFAAFLLFVATSARASTTQILYDGYYKLTLGDQHIGFIIQRYEYDPKKKTFHNTYLMKTNKLGGDIQESVKAVSNDKFQPISYSYTSQVGQKVKTIDGTFKGEIMKLIKTDGKIKRDETYKIPKDTFLSSFLGFLMLQKGISVGHKFSYNAIAEEDGDAYNGEAYIKEKVTYLGLPAFRILNKFKGAAFVSYMSEKGEVLGTRSEENNIASVLVKEPSEATAGMNVPTSTLKLLFGSVPTGKNNSLTTAPASNTPPPTTSESNAKGS